MIKLGTSVVIMILLTRSVAVMAADLLKVPRAWTARNSCLFAINNSPDSKVALERLKIAAAAVDQAKSGFFPSVDLSMQYGQTNNPMYSFGNILNQGAFTSAIDFNDPGRTDDLNLKAGLNYRFYNGGRDQAATDAAEANLAGSEAEREKIIATLGFESVRGFLSIVQAQEMLSARKQSLVAIQASIDVARARYEAGDLLKEDLLNLEVIQSHARENLILAEHRLELSHRVFLNLMGLEDGPVLLNTSKDCGQKSPENRNFDSRPELRAVAYAEKAAEANLRAAQGGRLPTIDGFVSYQYDEGWVLDDAGGDSWMTGVKLNYTLFDGHRTSAAIAMARGELLTLREQRKKIELAIDLEVKQADLNYRQSIQRLQVTTKMVEQARESARLSRTRFKQGVILSSDLIDVETRLTDAIVRQSVAKANIKVALADLRRAMGLPQFDDSEENE